MEIRLHNVKKSYGSFEALKGIDLVLEEGKFYGLLGPNGAGKTTLFNLLIKNFKPSSGEILWEVDGESLPTKDFYQHIGIVFQSNRLDDNLTVEENLVSRGSLYGLSKSQVQTRITDLQSYLDVATLKKKKYGSLSGGQKQRIAIARALALKPEVIIFDEATSNLDPLTERRICNNLKQLHITQIVVTHRLNAIQDADTIYVVEKGKIIESGTHVELLQLKGAYYDSVNN